MNWKDIVNAELATGKTITEVAEEIGYARPSLSLALKDAYPGKTDKIAAAVIRTYTNRHQCPHLGEPVTADQCEGFAGQAMPTSDPKALRHWTACQACPMNSAANRAASNDEDGEKRECA